MLSLLSIVLTFLALIIISCLFSFQRLKVPLNFTNILRLIKLTVSKQNDDQESSSSTGEKEKRPIPKHVAIILDGNRRWAKKRGLSTSEGHEAGAKRLRDNARDCFAMGTNTMSLFAFSTENWGRPQDEVTFLMAMLEKYLKSEIPFFQRRTNIPESLLGAIQEVEEATKSYEGKLLIIAIDYSGRLDILQACKSLAEKAKNGVIQVEDIDEKAMDKELMTNCSEFPNPDLLIRTSGEHRISNFFLWQSAYTELYFPDVLWPDFGEAHILEALTSYQSRQRRFGKRV